MGDGTYAANATAGRIHAAAGFASATVDGADQTSPPLVLGDSDGNPHTFYLRGGILCAS